MGILIGNKLQIKKTILPTIYNAIKSNSFKIHYFIQNDYATYSGGALHRVTAHTSQDSPLIWESLFTSPIAGKIQKVSSVNYG